MCIAIPSKVITIQNGTALVECYGTRRQVSLLLLEDVQVGDYVIVQTGFAIEKVTEEQSNQAFALFDELMQSDVLVLQSNL